MDKLIIVLVGIALSAAVLLWSTDYLSATYTNAASTARAQKWIAEAAQIAVAARQAGALSLAGDNWELGSSTPAVAGALVTAYLSDLPRHNGLYVFLPCGRGAASSTECPLYGTGSGTPSTLVAIVENANVCQAIQTLGSPHSTTVQNVTFQPTGPYTIFLRGFQLKVNTTPQFACVIGSDGNYYFVYHVFLNL